MIAVVVLNWNGYLDTIACLESLKRITGKQVKVIVCDNCSTDSSWKNLQAYACSDGSFAIHLLQTGANLGYAAGNNVGISYALSDPEIQYVWLLNNDTVVASEALNALVGYMSQHPDVGICGSTLCYLDAPNMIQAVGGKYHRWLGISEHVLGHEKLDLAACRTVKVEQLDYVVGASMFIRREALERVGLLSEDYFLYCEEIDWVTRMHRIAPEYKIGYAPDSIVYHREGASTGVNDRGMKSYRYFSDYFFITSRLRFARKFYPFRSLTVQASMFLVAMSRMKRQQWRSAVVALWCFCGVIPEFMDPRKSGSA